MARFGAGYDQLFVWRKHRELQAKIEQLEKTNATLRGQLAELQTGRVSEQQERAELSRNLGELQSQLARQNRDVAFYRGIVNSSVGAPVVKIQRLLAARSTAPGHYRLRVVLIPAVRSEATVAGTLAFSIRGTERGRSVSYGLARLTTQKRDGLPFSFKYFQNVDQEVVLPEGFAPSSIDVEVRASGRSSQPLTQSFAWNVQPF